MAGMTPHFSAATMLDREEWQGVTIELLGDVVSSGMVRYRFLLAARGPAEDRVLWISSERSRLVRGGASQGFFLGLFENGAHTNLGQSKDWSDRRLFVLKAMTLVRRALPRPLALWPVNRLEKDALRELWEESTRGARAKTRLRDYLQQYDAALPPMLSRRPSAAAS